VHLNHRLSTIATLVAMVAVAVIARWLPHPPNFTPLAAMALFAGATMMRPWVSAATIVTAMLVSDALIGVHSLMPVIYGCLLLNVWIGHRWLANRSTAAGPRRAMLVVGGSLLGSVVFFAVTNFGHWLCFYPHTTDGLFSCFTAAIPFFQYTVTGDLFYAGVFFSAHAFAGRAVGVTSHGKTSLVGNAVRSPIR